MQEPNKNTAPILIIAGTRPEIIKLAPVYLQLKKHGHLVLFCASMQHQNLSAQFLDFFDIKPDFILNVAQKEQSLTLLSSKLLAQLDLVLTQTKPQLVIVQGDTMTTSCGALAAFLHKIPVAHIEAGLRTGDLQAPFPEELNRKICSLASTLHFAPTTKAQQNLLAENIAAENIFLVGNTVIDALKIALPKISLGVGLDQQLQQQLNRLKTNFDKIILLTMHRRESFGLGLENLAKALIKTCNSRTAIIHPKHPNPATDHFAAILEQNLANQLFIIPPAGYADFINLQQHADVIITDSGGTLEEASSLGKNVICVREKTERPEGLIAKNVQISGFDLALITQAILNSLSIANSKANTDQAYCTDIFGDGNAAEKIVTGLEEKILLTTQQLPREIFLPAKLYNTNGNCPTIAIFGLGYVGLPTAIILANSGFKVIGIDIDKNKLDNIQNQSIDYLEPDLQPQLANAINNHTLRLYSTLTTAVDFFIICVPTPLIDGKADTGYVFACISQIAKNINPGALILLESTIPVGTTKQLETAITTASNFKANVDFFVAYCPERVLPGNITKELINNDRVIGAEHPTAFLLASKLYQSFCRGNLSWVDFKTAETVKLLENSYRNLQVAFANEAFDIAQQLNINAHNLITTTNRHPRVKILNPGPGVGGHCVAIDPIFLSQQVNCPLLTLAIKRNQQRPEMLATQIINAATNFAECKILALGVTYKPDVADTRESPAIAVIQKLTQQKNITLKIYDPFVTAIENNHSKVFCIAAQDLLTTINQANIVVILVAHTKFIEILNNLDLSQKIIFDPTNFLDKMPKQKSSINIKPIAGEQKKI